MNHRLKWKLTDHSGALHEDAVTSESNWTGSLSSLISETGSKLSDFKAQVFATYAFVCRPKSYAPFAGVLAVFEFLQFFSFTFWGPVESAWETSYGLQYVPLVRTFGAGWLRYTTHVAVLWLVIIFLWTSTAFGAVISRRLERGEEQWDRLVRMFRATVLLLPVLYLPSLHFLVDILNCSAATGMMQHWPDQPCSSGANIAFIVVSAPSVLVLFFRTMMCICFVYPMFPQKGEWFSMVNSRHRIALFFFETVLVAVAELFQAFDSPALGRFIYGLLLVVFNLYMVVHYIHFIPHHNRYLACTVSAAFSVSLLSACFHFVGGISNASSLNGLIAFIVSVPFAAAAGYGLTLYRLRSIDRRAAAALEGSSVTRFRDFEYEIATRFAYNSSGEEAVKAAMTIYNLGLEQRSTSRYIRVWHAIFAVTHPECQQQDIHTTLVRLRRLGVAFDMLYQMFRVEELRRRQIREEDGGDQEINVRLARAARYQAACKKVIRSFWRHLSRDEVAALPELVSRIDRFEKAAERIYMKLLAMFPNSVRALRAFGQFLDEIKGEPELGLMLFHNADRLEEELSKIAHEKNGDAPNMRQFSAPYATNAEKDDEVPLSKRRPSILKQTSFQLPLKDVADEDIELVTLTKHLDDPDPRSDGSPAKDHMLPTSTLSLEMLTVQSQKRSSRIDAIRRTKFRKRIERSKSVALKRLALSIKVVLGIMLAAVLFMFIAERVAISRFEDTDMKTIQWSQLEIYNSLIEIHARQMHKAAVQSNASSFELNSAMLFNASRDWFDVVSSMHAAFAESFMQPFVETPDYRVKYFYKHADPQVQVVNLTLHEMLTAFHTSAFVVSDFDQQQMLDAPTDVDFRLLMDGGAPMSEGFAAVNDALLQRGRESCDKLTIALACLLPAAAVLLALVAAFVFWPTLTRIKRERSDAMRLFTAIPKQNIAQIYEKLTRRTDTDDEAKDQEELNMELASAGDIDAEMDLINIMPLIKSLALRFVIVVGAMFLVVVLLFALGMEYSVSHVNEAPQIAAAYAMRAHAKRLEFLAGELTFSDPYTFPNVSTVQRELAAEADGMRRQHRALLHGDADTPGILATDPYLTYDVYDKPCRFWRPTTKCNGYEMLVDQMTQDALELATFPPSHLNDTDSTLLNLWFIAGFGATDADPAAAGGYLTLFVLEIARMLIDDALSSRAASTGAMIAVFVLSFPITIVCYLFLRPLENRLRKENARTMKMLLMIPMDVIDQVPALREILETGRHEDAQQKLKEAYEESVVRNEAMVQSSVDGIVVIGADKNIEMMNPAAEEMFGWTLDNVKGKNVRILMPRDVGEMHDAYVDDYLARHSKDRSFSSRKVRELIGRRHGGGEFPLQLALSMSTVNRRVFIAAFIKDVTELRAKEEALRQEKEKSERLLQSMLPALIADQLKEVGIENSKNIVAEKYAEVTVLFADIVGFTELSSVLSPSELVYTLNRVFSAWDKLCDEHGVEKIKTIGDCYMCCGGVPERTLDHATRVLEFAVHMLEALEDFNRSQSTCKLNLRVGINTGPVVAGVLGLKKMTYDLWGDTVNIASRMESTGVIGQIQVSHTTYEALKHDYIFEDRGRIKVKGKGDMLAYLLKGRRVERTSSGRTVRTATLDLPADSELAGYSAASSNRSLMHSSDTTAMRTFQVPAPDDSPAGWKRHSAPVDSPTARPRSGYQSDDSPRQQPDSPRGRSRLRLSSAQHQRQTDVRTEAELAGNSHDRDAT